MNSTADNEERIAKPFLWTTVEIVRFVTLIFAGCTIVLFNGLIVVVIAKYRKLRSWTNCLLLSMAVADLLVGVFSIPTHLIADLNVFGGHILWCIVLNIPTIIIPIASIFSLIAASVERLLAIVSPLRYPLWVSRRRILITIALIWIYSVTLGMLPIFGWNNIEVRQKTNASLDDCNFATVMSGPFTGFFIAGHIIPGMIILLCLNAKLFTIVKRQRKKMSSSGACNLVVPDSSTPAHSQTGSRRSLSESSRKLSTQHSQIQRNRRLVFILLGICHLTVLSYIPLCVAFVMDTEWFTVTLITDWKAPYLLYAVGVLLGAMNSMVNPIILGFANREIRKHLKLLCRVKLAKSERPNSLSLIISNTHR